MDYNQPELFRQLLVWQYLHNYQYFDGQPLALMTACSILGMLSTRFMQTWINFFPRLSLNNFWFQICINFIGSPLYKEFLVIIWLSLLYFAILTYINEL